MSQQSFTLTRAWGMLTGMLLAVAALFSQWLGRPSTMLEMLAVSIAAFELTLMSHDWMRRRRHGRS